jgi:uncharacterized protein YndB with AHSA1/START domain
MSTKNKSTKELAGQEIIITHTFDAPRKLVFQAWLEPKHLTHWWGPRGFTNPVCKVDARPGGAIYIVMRGPNGVDYPMGGEFGEITPHERLAFTSGALDDKGKLMFEFSHVVTFVEQKKQTTLTITSRITQTTPGADKYTSGFKAGMTQSLERLADYLAKV